MKPLTGLPVDSLVRVSEEVGIPLKNLLELVQQVEGGASAAFLSRYRADLCAGIGEDGLQRVLRKLSDLRDLIDRRVSMVASLGQRGLLSDELRSQLEQAKDRRELNDMYMPYRERRPGAAEEATEKGLEPLARMLWMQEEGADIEAELAKHVEADNGLGSASEVLEGAYAIAAQWLSDKPEILQALRKIYLRDLEIVLTARPGAAKVPRVQELDGFRAKLSAIDWRKHLAIRRGLRTGLLQMDGVSPTSAAAHFLERRLIQDVESPYAPHLRAIVERALDNGLADRIKHSVQSQVEEQADEEGVEAYSKALRAALLAPPAADMNILGIEITRSGEWHASLIDADGRLAECAVVRSNSKPGRKKGDAGADKDSASEEAADSAEQPEAASEAAPEGAEDSGELAAGDGSDKAAKDSEGNDSSAGADEDPATEAAAESDEQSDGHRAAESEEAAGGSDQPPAEDNSEKVEAEGEGDEGAAVASEESAPEAKADSDEQSEATSEASPDEAVDDAGELPAEDDSAEAAAESDESAASDDEGPAPEESVDSDQQSEAASEASPEAEASAKPEAEDDSAEPVAEAASDDGSSETSAEEATADGSTAEAAKSAETRSGDRRKKRVSEVELSEFLASRDVDLIIYSSGPKPHSTRDYLRSQIRKSGKLEIPARQTRDSGARVFSHTPMAKKQYRRLPSTFSTAAIMARRAQDPLAELAKADFKSAGIGQNFLELNSEVLRDAFRRTLECAAHEVGVDVNKASVALLSLVPGLTGGLAKRIVEHRSKNGPFESREALRRVDGLRDRVFAQAVGFLRVQGGDPLDNTGAHPEYKELHEQIADAAGCDLSTLLNEPDRLDAIDPEQFVSPERSIHLVNAAISELKPERRKARDEFKLPERAVPLRSDEELQAGSRVSGIVANTADFGAFVDIGADQDGFLHISQIKRELVADSKPTMQAGDPIEVFIRPPLPDSRRIGLSMYPARSAPGRDSADGRGRGPDRRANGKRRPGGRNSGRRGGDKPFRQVFGPDSERQGKRERADAKLSVDEKLNALTDKYRTKV